MLHFYGKIVHNSPYCDSDYSIWHSACCRQRPGPGPVMHHDNYVGEEEGEEGGIGHRWGTHWMDFSLLIGFVNIVRCATEASLIQFHPRLPCLPFIRCRRPSIISLISVVLRLCYWRCVLLINVSPGVEAWEWGGCFRVFGKRIANRMGWEMHFSAGRKRKAAVVTRDVSSVWDSDKAQRPHHTRRPLASRPPRLGAFSANCTCTDTGAHVLNARRGK